MGRVLVVGNGEVFIWELTNNFDFVGWGLMFECILNAF